MSLAGEKEKKCRMRYGSMGKPHQLHCCVVFEINIALLCQFVNDSLKDIC